MLAWPGATTLQRQADLHELEPPWSHCKFQACHNYKLRPCLGENKKQKNKCVWCVATIVRVCRATYDITLVEKEGDQVLG